MAPLTLRHGRGLVMRVHAGATQRVKEKTLKPAGRVIFSLLLPSVLRRSPRQDAGAMDRRVQITPADGCAVRIRAPARHPIQSQRRHTMPSKTASRPEGERWFEWPLTPDQHRHDGGRAHQRIVRDHHPRSTATAAGISRMVAPARFGDIIIDREAGCLRAKCAWKAKDPSQLGPAPAGYVRGE